MRVPVKLNRKRAAASSVGRIFCEKIGTHFSGKCSRFNVCRIFFRKASVRPGSCPGQALS